MTARDALGRQFLHASPHELEPGTVLTPGGGKSSFGRDNAHVFMSDNPDDAHYWARDIAHSEATAHTYEVAPEGHVSDRPVRFTGADSTRRREYLARKAVVVRKVSTTHREGGG